MQQAAIRQRNLGGLVTSAIGLGCMGLSQGYGPADDADSVRVIHRALDLGVTLLDTAMSYGEGHNERLIARALRGRAERALVATKFGIVRGAGGVRVDGRPEHVRGFCDASLRRLGRDVIDLYYLHRVDPDVPVADTVGAMAALVTEGKVRHLGLSEATPAQLEQAAAVHPISAVEFEWSLLWRDPEDDVVPAARRLGTGLVPYSPLGRGLLTATLGAADIDGSDFRRADPRFHGPALDRNLGHVAVLRDLAAGLGLTPGQLALAWLLAQGPDVVPIPGSRRPDRIAENAAAAGVQLSPADLERLEAALPRSGWAGDRRSFAVPVTTRAGTGQIPQADRT
jgi:aryl-alcohol dehydrogenase-like predicted oxidoreductase